MTPSESDEWKGFRPEDFPARGTISVSKEALTLAVDFLGHLRTVDSEVRWIATFSWGTERKYRKSSKDDWIDMGPGIDSCGYRISELPAGVVEVRDGIEVAFIIPAQAIDSVSEKRIIVVENLRGVRAAVKLV
jgi:hypothetical protein